MFVDVGVGNYVYETNIYVHSYYLYLKTPDVDGKVCRTLLLDP